MTNGNLMGLFRQRFPKLTPVDFRPPSTDYASNRVGLTVWLDNGDIILWFPQLNEGDTE